MSKCRSCGADIVWAKTTKGKAIPLDPAPVEGGNIYLSADDVALVTTPGERPLHVSHFTTCPQAAEHRRPR